MWSRLQLTGFTFPVRSATPWADIEREVFYWQPEGNQTATFIARTQNEDAVDFWYRNQAGFDYNINAELERIKGRTLVVHVDTDKWLLVDNARKAAKAVEGADFASFADPTAHYGVFRAPNVLKDTIQAFVDNRFTTHLPGIGGGGGGGPAARAAEKAARATQKSSFIPPPPPPPPQRGGSKGISGLCYPWQPIGRGVNHYVK